MAYRWAVLVPIVAFVALVQLAPATQASEPGLASAAVSGSRTGNPKGNPTGNPEEFQALVGDRVFFAQGSAALSARARKALAAQAAWLAQHPALRVTVEGHADDPGGDDHRLSQQRAEAVRRRLIEAGVAPERIRTIAYGRRHLIALCGDPLCGPQNRRAVTVVGLPTATVDAGVQRLRAYENVRRSSPRRLY